MAVHEELKESAKTLNLNQIQNAHHLSSSSPTSSSTSHTRPPRKHHYYYSLPSRRRHCSRRHHPRRHRQPSMPPQHHVRPPITFKTQPCLRQSRQRWRQPLSEVCKRRHRHCSPLYRLLPCETLLHRFLCSRLLRATKLVAAAIPSKRSPPITSSSSLSVSRSLFNPSPFLHSDLLILCFDLFLKNGLDESAWKMGVEDGWWWLKMLEKKMTVLAWMCYRNQWICPKNSF